jgi:CobQ-like glutamine amidotransferase family enzyme
MEVKIGWLYPKLMSTYGDRGNVICLQQRCQWRGIDAAIVPLDRQTDATQFDHVDIIVGGGAQDRQQEIVMRDLQGAKADKFRTKIDGGTPGVFTCGSPQLLGKYYENPPSGSALMGWGFSILSPSIPVSMPLVVLAMSC